MNRGKKSSSRRFSEPIVEQAVEAIPAASSAARIPPMPARRLHLINLDVGGDDDLVVSRRVRGKRVSKRISESELSQDAEQRIDDASSDGKGSVLSATPSDSGLSERRFSPDDFRESLEPFLNSNTPNDSSKNSQVLESQSSELDQPYDELCSSVVDKVLPIPNLIEHSEDVLHSDISPFRERKKKEGHFNYDNDLE